MSKVAAEAREFLRRQIFRLQFDDPNGKRPPRLCVKIERLGLLDLNHKFAEAKDHSLIVRDLIRDQDSLPCSKPDLEEKRQS